MSTADSDQNWRRGMRAPPARPPRGERRPPAAAAAAQTRVRGAARALAGPAPGAC